MSRQLQYSLFSRNAPELTICLFISLITATVLRTIRPFQPSHLVRPENQLGGLWTACIPAWQCLRLITCKADMSAFLLGAYFGNQKWELRVSRLIAVENQWWKGSVHPFAKTSQSFGAWSCMRYFRPLDPILHHPLKFVNRLTTRISQQLLDVHHAVGLSSEHPSSSTLPQD